MKHYYIKLHSVLRLLLCAALLCPLAAFAQTATETPTLTPVIHLEKNTGGTTTTYTATFEALEEAPASYVTSGEGYYSLNLAEYNNPIRYNNRSSITKVIIGQSMKDLKPTSTAGWFSNWGG